MSMMKKIYYCLFCLLFLSCSPKLKRSLSKLSKPERTWVLLHPFKAKRAYSISMEVLRVKDSIQLVNDMVGKDNNGGKLDAFKHSYWMARLSQDIGKRAAYTLGKAHEKGNYQTYKKRRLEDGLLPDKPATEMDLHNNRVGIAVGHRFKKETKMVLMQKVNDSLLAGKLLILSKDKNGYFLDCNSKKIPLDSLKNKWETKKCLKPSNIESK